MCNCQSTQAPPKPIKTWIIQELPQGGYVVGASNGNPYGGGYDHASTDIDDAFKWLRTSIKGPVGTKAKKK